MDPDIQSAFCRSFRGKLYLRKASANTPLRLSRSDDKWSWGVTPEKDWLQAGGNQDSPTFSFHFDSASEDRLHYHITIPGPRKTIPGDPVPKKLGVSRNGYLGFYWVTDVTDYWKIEPLQMTAAGLICHWRDHRGYRVGAVKDSPHFERGEFSLLNVDEGEVLPFLLKPVS
ncbi:hypothetical protein [Pseudomonas sp. PSKL.D1]|uniref:hypothetical protein n=1 Tax=Pseudomonas sp. PSKL.D1 TaxID=3029060 RepID=UPI0023810896|nr:hypothetical protein [Pseudomonas sp. PSKL.D1]WDY58634.1 hypothetical protein PVV54_03060 [Pseudomonas sp. PSKL.D1]